ncbi:MAG: hypothetical protein Q9207_005544 [Kuettlingeria erythrocarpa]
MPEPFEVPTPVQDIDPAKLSSAIPQLPESRQVADLLSLYTEGRSMRKVPAFEERYQEWQQLRLTSLEQFKVVRDYSLHCDLGVSHRMTTWAEALRAVVTFYNTATAAAARGCVELAREAYGKTLDYLTRCYLLESVDENFRTVRECIPQHGAWFLESLTALGYKIPAPAAAMPPSTSVVQDTTSTTTPAAAGAVGVMDDISRSIANMIVQVDDNVPQWRDLSIDASLRDVLEDKILYPMQDVNEDLDANGILLYGPPGCGKTIMVQAIVREAGCRLIAAKGLYSKWQGDSEKNVKELFETAKRLAPCIVFIDDIESLVKARGDHDTSSVSLVKSDLLSDWSTLKGTRVIIVGATNLPEIIDSGFLPRLSERIYVPLPNTSVKCHLIKATLKALGQNSISATDANTLAVKHTDRFSCDDIFLKIRNLDNMLKREVRKAGHFKKVGTSEVYQRCAQGQPGARYVARHEIQTLNIRRRPLTMDSLLRQFTHLPPLCAAAEQRRFEYFDKQHKTTVALGSDGLP